MTIYAMVEVDALVDAQADEREEADEEHETAQESEYVHWLLVDIVSFSRSSGTRMMST